MDNRVGGSLSVQQAVDVLRQQWRSGAPDLVAIADMLIDFSTLSVLELVVVDAAESIAAGKSVQLSDYLSRFPQLEGQEASFSQMLSCWGTVDTPSQPPDGKRPTGANGFFSEASVHATENFPSKQKMEVSESKDNFVFKDSKTALPVMIGNFYCDLEIGRGSFGQVLRCKDKNLGRTVAIKIKEASDEKGLSEGFLHEARSISRLEHPNIVRLLQADETEAGVGYLVYEHVDGETLDKRVQRGDYSMKDCVHWIASIAEALDYAHRRGVIHRDVSPRNIMISAEGEARLLDFGLSSIDNVFYLEDRNRVLGTPNFMPPEQASGNPHWATSYADLFSLGSVLYYALTSKAPFSGSSTCDVLERVQKASPASLRSIRPEIPRNLEKVCLRALAKEPQMRFSTGSDMAAALINSIHVPPPVVSPSTRSNSLPLIAIGALLAVLGLGASILGISLLNPFDQNSTSTSAIEIEDFDVLHQIDETTHSLLFESPRDPPRGPINEPPILTITTAQLRDDWDVKVYVFDFNKKKWNLSEEVIGKETTIKPNHFQNGPNVVLFIAKNGNEVHLPTNPLIFDTASNIEREKGEDSGGSQNHIANNYYVASNHISWPEGKKLTAFQRNAPEPAGTASDEVFKDLRKKWNAGLVRFDKTGLKGVAYCTFAFWLDPKVETVAP